MTGASSARHDSSFTIVYIHIRRRKAMHISARNGYKAILILLLSTNCINLDGQTAPA